MPDWWVASSYRHGAEHYRPRILACLIAVLVLTLGACGNEVGDGGLKVNTGRSIIMISVDTLRSDRLPAYGYDGVETPAMDALRADGVLYERCYSPAPLTFPAHASLLTGLAPPETGVRDNLGYRLERLAGATLAERLSAEGYATGAVVSSYVMRRETGIDRGFKHYDDQIAGGQRNLIGELQRSGEETLAAAIEWLDSLEDGPFFLLFHLFEPHTPRQPPEPFASRYADPYDGEIAAADAVIGRLLEALRQRNLYDDSTILLLSDHGEGLDDHGEDEHGILLYRESLQVPLIVKLPGSHRAGAAVATPVTLIDVAPTLLALAGAEPAPELEGISLLRLIDEPALRSEAANRALYSETFHPQLRYGWSGLTSVIQGHLHYIEGVDPELYDLESDPGERHNLIRQDPETNAALQSALERYPSQLAPPVEEDAETRRALAALGYLSPTIVDAGDGSLPDPKESIAALASLRDGIAALRDQRPEAAISLLRQATEAIPGALDAWQFLGLAYEEAQRPLEAVAAYQKAFELSHGAPHLAKPLAELSLKLQRWEEAATYLGLAIREEPESLRLRFLQTQALLFAGNLDEALRTAESTVAKAPRVPDARYQLGVVRMGRGELESAEVELRRALELAPDHPAALNDLAVLLMSQGRKEEAVPLLERLVEIQPDNRAAQRNLTRLKG